jgi:hypothetical protein
MQSLENKEEKVPHAKAENVPAASTGAGDLI